MGIIKTPLLTLSLMLLSSTTHVYCTRVVHFKNASHVTGKYLVRETSGSKLTLWGIQLTGKKSSIVLEMLRKAEIASTEFIMSTFLGL